MIRKFKNGKILLKLDNIYDLENDSFYHNDMFMSDLYINHINGYIYICDFNTGICYELGSYLLQNPLKYLMDKLKDDNKMYLYPLSKKYSRSLLQDLENGY